ncbi:MAG TPA: polymer-forming cytoskeletal protein [Anaeromyxobacteraceae bacterium]|nr:polymer-forming cytoskeletal protein [Anaeromyxobacteraceae bacterium]
MATNDGSTIIGETITVTGNVSGEEDLTVRGRVEGSIAIGKTLIVEQTGVVRAEVQAGNCVISGVVVGNIAASESVEITKEARMVGDISAPRVIIADGASFRGRVDMGDVNVDAAGEERPARIAQPVRPALRPPARPERPAARLPERVPVREEEGSDEEERSFPPSKPPAPPVPVGLGAVKRKVIVRRK